MRWRLGLVAAAAAGAVIGAVVVMSLPTPGVQLGPRPPEPRSEPEVLGRAPVRTLLAWTPGALPAGYPETVRGHRAILSVTVVRSGTVWLDAWGERSGTAARPPAGLRVPVEVAAVDPGSYRRFVPPVERAQVAGLSRGGAVLGETGARIRGISEGGWLRFGRIRIRVEGILPDELIGAHEVVVGPSTGTRLGVTRPRYMLVAPSAGVSLHRAERAVRRSLPPGTRLRVRAPEETSVFRHGDAVLPPAHIKDMFGEFAAAPAPGGFLRPDSRWVRANIRTAAVPILGEIRCHRLVIPLARAALVELEQRGLSDLVDPGDYAGCYSSRFIARDPGAGISHHAWGIALDLNVSRNGLGAEPSMDRRVVEVFERWGFTWGGRWLIPDGMHFEFLRFPLRD